MGEKFNNCVRALVSAGFKTMEAEIIATSSKNIDRVLGRRLRNKTP